VKIQTVTYNRLLSGENFSNQTIGATALVDPEQSPEDALDELERWVADRFIQRGVDKAAVYEVRNKVYLAQHELMLTEDKLAVAKRRWESVKKLSEALGVDLTDRIASLDDVPF